MPKKRNKTNKSYKRTKKFRRTIKKARGGYPNIIGYKQVKEYQKKYPNNPGIIDLRQFFTGNECSICGGDLTSVPENGNPGIMITRCGHVFHYQCLGDWCVRGDTARCSCPICRTSLNFNDSNDCYLEIL
jgi:hypothetical protein